MASSTQDKPINTLNVTEKLDLFLGFISIFGHVGWSLVKGLWKTQGWGKGSYKRFVTFEMVKKTMGRFSFRQLGYLNPSTTSTYEAYCKKRGLAPESEILPDGTKALWIGKKGAKNVLLNFHGGGYVLPAIPDMFEFLTRLVERAEKEGKSLGVLFLAYDLAPEHQYPRQFEQAASLLNHVLHTLSYPPSSILLSGDSAGGNLILALFSHITHPTSSPSQIPKISLQEPLKGAMLIAPWVTFATTAKSFETNKGKDLIDDVLLKPWSAAFQGSNQTNEFIEPLTAAPEWWKDLPNVVKDISVVVGGLEVFVDDIKGFVGKMKEGVGERLVEGDEGDVQEGKLRVGLQVAEGEYHDQAYMGIGFGDEKVEGLQAREIGRWVRGKC